MVSSRFLEMVLRYFFDGFAMVSQNRKNDFSNKHMHFLIFPKFVQLSVILMSSQYKWKRERQINSTCPSQDQPVPDGLTHEQSQPRRTGAGRERGGARDVGLVEGGKGIGWQGETGAEGGERTRRGGVMGGWVMEKGSRGGKGGWRDGGRRLNGGKGRRLEKVVLLSPHHSLRLMKKQSKPTIFKK